MTPAIYGLVDWRGCRWFCRIEPAWLRTLVKRTRRKARTRLVRAPPFDSTRNILELFIGELVALFLGKREYVLGRLARPRLSLLLLGQFVVVYGASFRTGLPCRALYVRGAGCIPNLLSAACHGNDARCFAEPPTARS